MNRHPDLDRFFMKYDLRISLLMILFVAGRKWFHMQNTPYQPLSLGLICVFAAGFLLFPMISRKIGKWIWIYLLCQILMIEVLGFLPPEEDTWGLLYIPLWAEMKLVYPARQSYFSMGALGLLMIATLMLTFDWYIGLGYGVFMTAVGFILLTPDLVYAQSLAAHAESQRLLRESKKANSELKKAARQAAELTAIQERIRLANELHDSVSQLMFSIKLLAQSTRLLMDKNPDAVLPQLEQLQELSSRALNQMRGLITQWRDNA
jgi:signal transduction histidine kinase